ncbi:hypothetical protein HDE_11210 [Halotydeus destructor]|nr:hypothetical protein HDE_11210 [Halotydeus destructor]
MKIVLLATYYLFSFYSVKAQNSEMDWSSYTGPPEDNEFYVGSVGSVTSYNGTGCFAAKDCAIIVEAKCCIDDQVSWKLISMRQDEDHYYTEFYGFVTVEYFEATAGQLLPPNVLYVYYTTGPPMPETTCAGFMNANGTDTRCVEDEGYRMVGPARGTNLTGTAGKPKAQGYHVSQMVSLADVMYPLAGNPMVNFKVYRYQVFNIAQVHAILVRRSVVDNSVEIISYLRSNMEVMFPHLADANGAKPNLGYKPDVTLRPPDSPTSRPSYTVINGVPPTYPAPTKPPKKPTGKPGSGETEDPDDGAVATSSGSPGAPKSSSLIFISLVAVLILIIAVGGIIYAMKAMKNKPQARNIPSPNANLPPKVVVK